MTVGAAIAPVAGYDGRQRASRMIVVGVAYVAVVAAGAIYPLVSPLRDFWNALPPPEIAANALGGLVWLPILLVAIARQPNGRLWKLIVLLAGVLRIDALEYVPNSVVFSLARAGERCSCPSRIRTSHRELPFRRAPGSVRSGRRGLRLPAGDRLDPQGDRVRGRLVGDRL